MATGFKRVTAEQFPRGHVEKAESQAIGRAIAAAGYGIQFEPEFEDGDDGFIADAPHERSTGGVQSGQVAQGKSPVRAKGSKAKQSETGTSLASGADGNTAAP